MFGFATATTGTNLAILLGSYNLHTDFVPVQDWYYLCERETKYFPEGVTIVPNIVFQLNSWLADGLFLYRCYVIYAKSYWVVAFPSLVYLASVATGMMFIYSQTIQDSILQHSTELAQHSLLSPCDIDLSTPHYLLSLSLNVLLTTIIVIRLVWFRKEIKDAMGASAITSSGLYKAVITMLIESFALYASIFALFIGFWSTGSPVADLLFPILIEIQVIAPFLIILRVAERRAITSERHSSGNLDPIRFGGSIRSKSIPDEYAMDFTCKVSKATVKRGARVEISTGSHNGEV